METLTTLIFVALTAWTVPQAKAAKDLDHQVVDLQPWAEAMSDVCQNPRECLTLAATAYEETGMVRWAVDQKCNDGAWRRSHGMDKTCDGGKAIGAWQIWDDKGAPSLLGASPEIQASVALEKMRRRPQQWTTWAKASARAEAWLRAHPQ
jgi:hypothetical protein